MRSRLLTLWLVAAGSGCSDCRPTNEASPVAEAPNEDPILSDIVDIDASGYGTCALRRDGQLFCWGTPAVASREEWHAVPVLVPALPRIRAFDVADMVVYAISKDDAVYAWGSSPNPRYKVTEPDGLNQARAEFAKLAKDHPEQLEVADWGVSALLASTRAIPTRLYAPGKIFVSERDDDLLCTYSSESVLTCSGIRYPSASLLPSWEESESQELPGLIALAPFAFATNLDENPGCLVFDSGELRCWRHQPKPPSNEPLNSGQSLAPDMTTKTLHLDGPVKSALGTPYAWNFVLEDGRLATMDGDYNIEYRTDLGKVEQFHQGGAYACVLTKDRDVKCWVQREPEPKTIRGLDHPIKVVTGTVHMCALLADGHVQCWGHNSMGGCGVGDFRENVPTPTFVVSPTEVGSP